MACIENLYELAKERPDITLTISTGGLLEFGNYLIDNAKRVFEIENEMKKSKETYLSPEETAELVGVSLPTLWRYNKEKILCHTKVGGRCFYRRSEIDALMNGKEATL